MGTDCELSFMTSRAFRSTLNYDLQRVDNPPAVCTPELLNAAHSVSEPASDQFRFARDSSPIVCRFPLMDLPAELRVMIATYVLYVPEGHEWTWTTYRRRRHVATLQGCGLGEKPEELNALALTCRVIHQEIKGLILKINVIRFSLHKSHSYVISEICRGYIRASDHDLWGFQEALQLFQLCNLRECRPNARRFELIYYYSIQHLEKSLDQFLDVTNGQQELKISVVLEEWVVAPLDDDERRELVGLEEDGEPFVPESEQMQKRVSDYMQEGNQVQDFVERVGGENRNWRFFPNLVSKHEALDLSKIMTPEVETMTKEWETNGVQKWASGEVLSALCSRVWFRPNVLSVVSEL